MIRSRDPLASTQPDGVPISGGLVGLPMFAISVNQEDGGVVVAPHGEIDIATAPQLREAIARALDADVSSLVIDLADVPFIDSTAVHVFSTTARRLWASGGTFRLRSVTPGARRVLELVGLLDAFGVDEPEYVDR